MSRIIDQLQAPALANGGSLRVDGRRVLRWSPTALTWPDGRCLEEGALCSVQLSRATRRAGVSRRDSHWLFAELRSTHGETLCVGAPCAPERLEGLPILDQKAAWRLDVESLCDLVQAARGLGAQLSGWRSEDTLDRAGVALRGQAPATGWRGIAAWAVLVALMASLGWVRLDRFLHVLWIGPLLAWLFHPVTWRVRIPPGGRGVLQDLGRRRRWFPASDCQRVVLLKGDPEDGAWGCVALETRRGLTPLLAFNKETEAARGAARLAEGLSRPITMRHGARAALERGASQRAFAWCALASLLAIGLSVQRLAPGETQRLGGWSTGHGARVGAALGSVLTPQLIGGRRVAHNVRWARFSSDGRRVISSDLERSILWDVEAGEALDTMLPRGALNAVFTRDGRGLLMIHASHRLLLSAVELDGEGIPLEPSLRSAPVELPLRGAARHRPSICADSLERFWIASADRALTEEGYRAGVRLLDDASEARFLAMPAGANVLAVALSASCDRLVVLTDVAGARAFDLEHERDAPARLVARADFDGPLSQQASLALDAHGARWAIVEGLAGAARVWLVALDEGRMSRVVSTGSDALSWAHDAALDPSGQRLVVLTRRRDQWSRLRVFDLARGGVMRADLRVDSVDATLLGIMPGGDAAATAGLDGWVRIWAL